MVTMSLTFAHLEEIGLLTWTSSSQHSDGLVQQESAVSSSASAAPKAERSLKEAEAKESQAASTPFQELSQDALAKLTKEERKAYHIARRAAATASQTTSDTAPANVQITKAKTREIRRAIQEAQRKVKLDKSQAASEQEELLKELVMQGLHPDQARKLMAEMGSTDALEEDGDDDDELEEDLFSSVRRWMSEQGDAVSNAESLHEFNMSVRFQGHVESTPPDHLSCIVRVIADKVCAGYDLSGKVQPAAVSKAAMPLIAQWLYMIELLYEKIDNSPEDIEPIDVVVGAVSESVMTSDAPKPAQESAVVGIIMAIREQADSIADEDLMFGCKRMEGRSNVMDKFIDFLEDAMAEDDDDDDDTGDDED